MLDLLRVTRRDDGVLLLAYQAAAEMRAWRTMRIETITRMVIPAIFAIIAILVSPALITGLLYFLSPRQWFMLFFLFTIAVFWVRMLLLYIREPLLRMRVVVAISICVALRIRDTSTAMLLSSGIVGLLRLLQFAVLYALVEVTLRLFTSNLAVYDDISFGFIAWLWLLSSFLMPAVRWGYQRAGDWLLRLSVASLRSSS
jgi:hypothetical protein